MRSKSKISKKVFRQLASKNVKKSAKDYFIYFFTLTFAVCLFYTFNSIGAQFAAFQIPDTLNYLSAAQGAMAGVSLFVCGIIGFLVVYANRFLMKRRKREFGIYSVLGMERKDIGKILMKETVLIGTASLISGILLGILTSQGLTMITGKIAGVSLAEYHFIFSGKALLAAVIFFGITFLCVHIFNVREMKKMKLIDLLYSDRKNEEIKTGRKYTALTGILSLLFIASGYFLIFYWSDRELLKSIGAGGALIGAGTFFLFFSFAVFILELLKKRKNIYYRRLNLFVLNQLGSRMKSAGVSVAVVCILMFSSVSVMGIGMGLGESAVSIKNKTAPFDVSIGYFYDGMPIEESVRQYGIEKVLESQDSQLLTHLEKKEEITFYEQDNLTMRKLFEESIKNYPTLRKYINNSAVWFIGLEDYNRTRTLLGLEPIKLAPDEYAITYNMPEAKGMLETYAGNPDNTLVLGGTTLTLQKGGIYETTLNDRNVLSDLGTFIVPQELAENGIPAMSVMNGLYTGSSFEGYDAFLHDSLEIKGFQYESRKDIQVEILSDKLISTYIGSYLGITFLVTAGAVLALQQLTQSTDNKKRYELLFKIGAGERAMKKSLLTQMLFYFGLPFGVAALHSGMIMAGVFRNIPYLSPGDAARNIILSVGLAVILYSVYFITTYSGSKRILKL